MRTLVLALDLWRLSCGGTTDGQALQALSRATEILSPCGIQLKLGRDLELEAKPAWCDLPLTEGRRRPMLEEIGDLRRRMNPRGLSLFVLPKAGGDARYSFALVDKSAGAGCGGPEPQFLARFGSLFMTDFAFDAKEEGFPGLLLAHEIAHALTMSSHPTHAPRGSLLADHLADLGPKIPPKTCACMRQSPYLTAAKP